MNREGDRQYRPGGAESGWGVQFLSIRKASKETVVERGLLRRMYGRKGVGGGAKVVSCFPDVLLCHESLERPRSSKFVPDTRTKIIICPSRKRRWGEGIWEN